MGRHESRRGRCSACGAAAHGTGRPAPGRAPVQPFDDRPLPRRAPGTEPRSRRTRAQAPLDRAELRYRPREKGGPSPENCRMDEHDDLVVALSPFIDLLDRLGVAWYVGGSVASTVHGHFRATNDVDVIACLREEHAAAIRKSLEADHYVDESSIREAVQRRSSFNLVHYGTGLKIDVFVPPDSEYEAGVRARRIAEPFGADAMPAVCGSPRRKTRCSRSSPGTVAAAKCRRFSGATCRESSSCAATSSIATTCTAGRLCSGFRSCWNRRLRRPTNAGRSAAFPSNMAMRSSRLTSWNPRGYGRERRSPGRWFMPKLADLSISNKSANFGMEDRRSRWSVLSRSLRPPDAPTSGTTRGAGFGHRYGQPPANISSRRRCISSWERDSMSCETIQTWPNGSSMRPARYP